MFFHFFFYVLPQNRMDTLRLEYGCIVQEKYGFGRKLNATHNFFDETS